jgi:hypothetical protein
MLVIWMVPVTLGLAVCGVHGLALASHDAARAGAGDHHPSVNRTGF